MSVTDCKPPDDPASGDGRVDNGYSICELAFEDAAKRFQSKIRSIHVWVHEPPTNKDSGFTKHVGT